MIDERDLERLLVRGIKRAGGMCIKLQTPIHIPDRLVLGPGGHVEFVELKRPGVKPRAGQEEMHKRLRALGFKVKVIDSEIQVNCAVARLSKASRRARSQGKG